MLCGLVIMLLAAPFFGETARGQNELGILFSILVIGFVIASQRLHSIALMLACAWLCLTWIFGLQFQANAVLLGLCIVTVYSVLCYTLTARRVTVEVLAAAIAAYILLGIIWALIFDLLETSSPGSLHLTPDGIEEPWSAILYFSFATLTTLGYGDIAPVSLTARSWAAVEAMSGSLYLAILIARLVSMYQSEAE